MSEVTTETKGVETEDSVVILLLQLAEFPHSLYTDVSALKAPCIAVDEVGPHPIHFNN